MMVAMNASSPTMNTTCDKWNDESRSSFLTQAKKAQSGALQKAYADSLKIGAKGTANISSSFQSPDIPRRSSKMIVLDPDDDHLSLDSSVASTVATSSEAPFTKKNSRAISRPTLTTQEKDNKDSPPSMPRSTSRERKSSARRSVSRDRRSSKERGGASEAKDKRQSRSNSREGRTRTSGKDRKKEESARSLNREQNRRKQRRSRSRAGKEEEATSTPSRRSLAASVRQEQQRRSRSRTKNRRSSSKDSQPKRSSSVAVPPSSAIIAVASPGARRRSISKDTKPSKRSSSVVGPPSFAGTIADVSLQSRIPLSPRRSVETRRQVNMKSELKRPLSVRDITKGINMDDEESPKRPLSTGDIARNTASRSKLRSTSKEKRRQERRSRSHSSDRKRRSSRSQSKPLSSAATQSRELAAATTTAPPTRGLVRTNSQSGSRTQRGREKFLHTDFAEVERRRPVCRSRSQDRAASASPRRKTKVAAAAAPKAVAPSLSISMHELAEQYGITTVFVSATNRDTTTPNMDGLLSSRVMTKGTRSKIRSGAANDIISSPRRVASTPVTKSLSEALDILSATPNRSLSTPAPITPDRSPSGDTDSLGKRTPSTHGEMPLKAPSNPGDPPAPKPRRYRREKKKAEERQQKAISSTPKRSTSNRFLDISSNSDPGPSAAPPTIPTRTKSPNVPPKRNVGRVIVATPISKKDLINVPMNLGDSLLDFGNDEWNGSKNKLAVEDGIEVHTKKCADRSRTPSTKTESTVMSFPMDDWRSDDEDEQAPRAQQPAAVPSKKKSKKKSKNSGRKMMGEVKSTKPASCMALIC